MTGPAPLLLLLAMLALFWLIVLRPARASQRAVRDTQTALAVGDEVVISAGIFGTVRSVEDNKVSLEIAPNTVITVARQVVVRRVEADAHTELPAAPDEES